MDDFPFWAKSQTDFLCICHPWGILSINTPQLESSLLHPSSKEGFLVITKPVITSMTFFLSFFLLIVVKNLNWKVWTLRNNIGKKHTKIQYYLLECFFLLVYLLWWKYNHKWGVRGFHDFFQWCQIWFFEIAHFNNS